MQPAARRLLAPPSSGQRRADTRRAPNHRPPASTPRCAAVTRQRTTKRLRLPSSAAGRDPSRCTSHTGTCCPTPYGTTGPGPRSLSHNHESLVSRRTNTSRTSSAASLATTGLRPLCAHSSTTALSTATLLSVRAPPHHPRGSTDWLPCRSITGAGLVALVRAFPPSRLPDRPPRGSRPPLFRPPCCSPATSLRPPPWPRCPQRVLMIFPPASVCRPARAAPILALALGTPANKVPTSSRRSAARSCSRRSPASRPLVLRSIRGRRLPLTPIHHPEA
jgi:hypothetical protein